MPPVQMGLPWKIRRRCPPNAEGQENEDPDQIRDVVSSAGEDVASEVARVNAVGARVMKRPATSRVCGPSGPNATPAETPRSPIAIQDEPQDNPQGETLDETPALSQSEPPMKKAKETAKLAASSPADALPDESKNILLWALKAQLDKLEPDERLSLESNMRRLQASTLKLASLCSGSNVAYLAVATLMVLVCGACDCVRNVFDCERDADTQRWLREVMHKNFGSSCIFREMDELCMDTARCDFHNGFCKVPHWSPGRAIVGQLRLLMQRLELGEPEGVVVQARGAEQGRQHSQDSVGMPGVLRAPPATDYDT